MYTITKKIPNGSTCILHERSPDSPRRLSEGKICTEINQIPKFTYSLTASNPCFSDEIHDRRDEIVIKNDLTGDVEFEGTVLTHRKSMSADGKIVKSVTCEGFLGFLCDSIQPYRHFEDFSPAEFLQELLDYHNSVTESRKHIHLGNCDFSANLRNSKTTAYRNTLEEIKLNLIERIGGEIAVRRSDGRLYLDFVQHLGVKSSTKIELAKNLKSLEVSSDSTHIITRLIPLGCQIEPDISAKRLDISTVNDGIPYIDDVEAMARFGVICGTAEFDDITLPQNLKNRGIEYLRENNRTKKAYKGQVLDLSTIDSSSGSIRCGNTYRFFNGFLGVDEDLRLNKCTVDIYKPYTPTVEIGDRSERITDVSVRTARLLEYDIPAQKTTILAAAKATATALITSGITGYVVVNGNEILVMDAPRKEDATRVWRWNSGGFGYSSTGYDGEYGTAVTMDGAINADFITAGILRGLEIMNGNGTFHVSPSGAVTASNITITGGSIRIATNDETYDVIELSKGDWKMQLSPLQVKLTNSAINSNIICQAGGFYFYRNGKNNVYISTDGTAIFNGVVTGDDFCCREGEGVISVKNQLESLDSRLRALGG